MSYLFTLDFSKLKKFYWKNFVGSKDANSFINHTYYNQEVTYLTNTKLVAETPNFKNYGKTKVTVYGKNLKGSYAKYTSYKESIPKLGDLIITSKKGVTQNQASSIVASDAWALKQNFIIKASKYNKKYGNDTNFSGNNLFLGSSASEKVFAGNGNDKLYGNNGNDKLCGESGNDKLLGESGNDLLVGGKGNDLLVGGQGKDIFKLSKGKGYDLIQDFKDKQDKIFTGSIKKIKLKNKGKDIYIYSGKDLLAKVKGAKGDLSKKGQYLV